MREMIEAAAQEAAPWQYKLQCATFVINDDDDGTALFKAIR